MEAINEIKRPSKEEQKLALKSYLSLVSALDHLKTGMAEIEIEETGEKIKVPIRALKLLEEGKIGFTKVGKHRRIKFEDVMKYRQKVKEEQKQHLIEIMNADEDSGLYDT